ncbi:MAG: outer membrane beta-barrel protein [Rikenellaceae bacterium]
MKKLSLLSALILLCATALNAQTIKGRVINSESEPIGYANVILYELPDTSYVIGVATNERGEFAFEQSQSAKYAIEIASLGYQTVSVPCRVENFEEITLTESSQNMDEVTVLIRRTEYDASGYSVNLRSSAITKGKQSAEALAFLPGISREEGSYKINGLSVSKIYVDGVELPNVGELNNIPADMIDNVKVDYLAGSRHNASMSGGVINITLRKPSEDGYYGSLNGGATYHSKYGFSGENFGGMIYYRNKKLSLYNNLSTSWNQVEESAEQSIFDSSTSLHLNALESIKSDGFNINNRLSLVYQLNEKSKLGVSYYISSDALDTYTSSILESATSDESIIDNDAEYVEQQATVKYSSMLNAKGASMDIVADYYNRQSSTTTSYIYDTSTESLSLFQNSLDLAKLAIDFKNPCSERLVLSYGASMQYISSAYTPTVDYNDTNRFVVSTNATQTDGFTPIAYLQAMGQLGRVMYSAGVNGQLNHIGYEELGVRSENNAWGVNPTLQLMMPLGKSGKHMFMLNYKRMLEDIPYSAISSTITWLDAYNYQVGNPNLVAPTTDMALAATSLWGNKLNLSALYAHSKSAIYWETLQSDEAAGSFYTTPINLPASQFGGFGAELNLTPLKWWSAKLSGRLEIHPEDVTLGGVVYDDTHMRQYYALYNSFSFSKGWGGMLNVIYEPTFTTYDRTYYTIYNLGGQLYKKMCHDTLQLSMTFNLLGDRRRYDSSTSGYTITYDTTTPVQNVGLSLVWRFKGGKQVNVDSVQGAQSYKVIKDVR